MFSIFFDTGSVEVMSSSLIRSTIRTRNCFFIAQQSVVSSSLLGFNTLLRFSFPLFVNLVFFGYIYS